VTLGGFMLYENMLIIESLLHQIPPTTIVFADRRALDLNVPVRLH
jgi:hypothetical protein